MLPHAIPGLGFAFALLLVAIVAAKWLPWLPLYQTIGIIILANVVNRLSYVTRITNAALLQVGQELEESAQVCGARRLGTMWWVIAPLVRSSLVFGGLWTGLLVFREVSMPLMLAGPKIKCLSVRVWAKWESGGLNEASALGVVMVLVMSAMILLPNALRVKKLPRHSNQQEFDVGSVNDARNRYKCNKRSALRRNGLSRLLRSDLGPSPASWALAVAARCRSRRMGSPKRRD